MQNKRKKKNQILHNPKSWKIIVPLIIVVVTLSFGFLVGITTNPLATMWKSVGHLIGDNSFTDIDKVLPVGSGLFAKICLWLSRITGVFLLPYAFFMLIYNEYHDGITAWRIRPWWKKQNVKYIVVCGLGWKGYELAKNLLDEKNAEKYKVVGIDTVDSNGQIEELCKSGMAFFKGDATSLEFLEKAKVDKASEVYIMTGNDELNSRIAMQLTAYLNKSFKAEKTQQKTLQKIECHVSVEDYRTRTFLENYASRHTDVFHIHCFNLLEQAARSVINEKGFFSQQADVKQEANVNDVSTPADMNVHCVIVGNALMAKTMLVQCLRILHLYSSQQRVITVICKNQERYQEKIFAEFPCLQPNGASDEMEKARKGVFPTIRFVEMPATDSEWRNRDFAIYDCFKQGWQNNIYMCVDDGIKSIALSETIYEQLRAYGKDKKSSFEVFNYFNYPEKEIGNLDKTCGMEFGSYAKCCTAKNIKTAASDPLAIEVFNLWPDKENREWIEIEGWSRESSRQAADHIYIKLALAGLTKTTSIDSLRDIFGVWNDETYEVETGTGKKGAEMAEIEHRRWCAERLLGGWLPLSMKYDNRAKWNNGIIKESDEAINYKDAQKGKFYRHGDLISFDELLPEEKDKDYKMIASIYKWTEYFKDVVNE